MIEKTSNTPSGYYGLVQNSDVEQAYLSEYQIESDNKSRYQVYLSKTHGNGSGRYKIDQTSTQDHKIMVRLSFGSDPLEIGSSVLNQRILFFRIKSHCRIIGVY